MGILYYLPLFVFIITLADGVIKPFTSPEVKALKEGLLSAEEGPLPDRIIFYDEMIDALEEMKEDHNLPSSMDEGEATHMIKTFKFNKGRIEGSSENAKKYLSGVITKHIFSEILSNLGVRILTNAGFIILLLTGHWVGILVTAITFIGAAMFVQHEVMIGEPQVLAYKKPEMVAALVGLVFTISHHLPFLIAVFVW